VSFFYFRFFIYFLIENSENFASFSWEFLFKFLAGKSDCNFQEKFVNLDTENLYGNVTYIKNI
jgi:hypothetical protein